MNIVVGLLLGSQFYYASTLITGSLFGMFILKTLNLATSASQQTPEYMQAYPSGTNAKRNPFLLVVAVLQLVLIYFLGHVAPQSLFSSFATPSVALPEQPPIETITDSLEVDVV